MSGSANGGNRTEVRLSPSEVLEPRSTSLVVVDLQRDICIPEYVAMLERTAGLIAAARRAGVVIIFVQNTVLRNGLSQSAAEIARRTKLGLPIEITVENTPGHEFVEEVRPERHDLVIQKHRLSAFGGTALDQHLRARNIETVVIVGAATHGCVTASAFAAQALNYYVVVVEDCVASWREELHDAALTVLRDSMSLVTDAAGIMSVWQSLTVKV